jgi:hypothetical protein
MTDDFRIWITVDGDGVVGELLEGLRTGDAAREVEGKLGERVVVSHADDQLFLYTATHEDAEAAAAAVRPAIEHHKLRVVEQRLQRWHPEAEVWEDAERPLPATEAEREAEHAHLQAVEASESRETRLPQWEVRVTLPDAQAARDYAERLEGEGLYVVRRSEFVLAGANTEDEARGLADRLRDGAPEGARFEVEANGSAVWTAMHPFAIFGGLGQ